MDERLRGLRDLGVTHGDDDTAAARIAARLPRRPRRRRGRVAALATVGVIALGSATAAAVTQLTRDSPPSRGPLPPLGSKPQGEYAVRLQPDLRVGETGWCTVVQRRTGQAGGGGMGCGSAATHAVRMVSGVGDLSSDPSQRSVIAVVVDDSVVAVRAGAERVIPREGPGLQPGMRLVILTPPGGDPTMRYGFEAADGTVTESDSATDDEFAPRRKPLDGEGGPCRVQLDGATRAQHIEGPLTPVADLIGRPFLTCASATADGVNVVELVDAAQPGTLPADLPGTQPVQGSDAVRLNARTVARRDGNAWLVAAGNDPATTLAVLNRAKAG